MKTRIACPISVDGHSGQYCARRGKRKCQNLDVDFAYCGRYDANLETIDGRFCRDSACIEQFGEKPGP